MHFYVVRCFLIVKEWWTKLLLWYSTHYLKRAVLFGTHQLLNASLLRTIRSTQVNDLMFVASMKPHDYQLCDNLLITHDKDWLGSITTTAIALCSFWRSLN